MPSDCPNNEIDQLPLELQGRLLRVLQSGEFERLGASAPISVDVRIVAATNKDLGAKCASGEFMPDLLDRLTFEVLTVPPLRMRQGDIIHLAQHFAEKIALELGRPGPVEFSSCAVETLESHRWPGNIRELKNVVERSVYRAEGPLVDTIVLDPFQVKWGLIEPAAQEALAKEGDASRSGNDLKAAVSALEIKGVKEALAATQYNQTEAAKYLGLTYHQFRGLYRKYFRHEK